MLLFTKYLLKFYISLFELLEHDKIWCWSDFALGFLLCSYDINQHLSDPDEMMVYAVLVFHPRSTEKIGSGLHEIKVRSNNLIDIER